MPAELCGRSIGSNLVAGRSGCLVRYTDDPSTIFILTALHVVVSASAARGDPISSLDSAQQVLGLLRNWGQVKDTSPLDAALVWIDPARVSPAIDGLGAPTGARASPIIANERLRLCPSTPGGAVRESRVQQAKAPISVSVSGPGWSRQVDYIDQIVCSPMFSAPGDSGAVVLDDNGNAVGIVVASFSDTSFGGQPCSQTIITPISAILSAEVFSGALEVVSSMPAEARAPIGLPPATAPAAPAQPQAAPLPQAPLVPHGAPAQGLVMGIDTLDVASSAALANASSQNYLGARPQFWGRYFYAPGQINSSGMKDSHYSAAENDFLHQNQIRLLPLARQTVRVTKGAAEGTADAKLNCDAIFESISVTALAATDPDVLVYLDVEHDTPLTVAYYEAWSSTLLSYSRTQSQNRVQLRPAIYTGPLGNETWSALRTAIENGAQCFGAWIARYYYGSPVPRDWSISDETKLLTPDGGTGGVPLLAWQYWASDNDSAPLNFDTSIAKPAYSDVLLAGMIMPPLP